MTDYLKLTTYFAERQRHDGRFFSDELLDLYAESAVATSIVLRGISSFGPHHELRSDQSPTWKRIARSSAHGSTRPSR